MKQKGFIPLLFDIFFAVCVFFIIAYLWFSSRLTPTPAMIISLSSTALFMLALSSIVLRRRKQKLYAQAKSAFDEALLRGLLMLSHKEFLDFCTRLICSVPSYSPKITIGDNEYGFFALQKHNESTLSCDEALECIRKTREMGLGRLRLILTCNMSPECSSMLKNIPMDIEVTEKSALCNIMRERNIFPAINDTLSVQETVSYKSRLVKAWNALINKNNAVRYLRYAAIMCIGSLLTRFNSYFIVSAVVFIVLSLLSGISMLRENRKAESGSV